MSLNLVAALEEQLQQKKIMKLIDPNTQAVNDEHKRSAQYLYQRGVIAAALVGLYQFSRDEANLKDLLNAAQLSEFPNRIFNNDFARLEQKIKDYSGYTDGNTMSDFGKILRLLVDILHEHAGSDVKAAGDFLSDQRANILSYIPGELQTGTMLGDSTLDDRTNKMHGPFSDFTHWMGQFFSRSDKS